MTGVFYFNLDGHEYCAIPVRPHHPLSFDNKAKSATTLEDTVSKHPWRGFGRFTPSPQSGEVSYVPTIAERLLELADQRGVGYVAATDDAQDETL